MASSSPCRSWPLQTCHPIGSSLLLQLPLQPASNLSPSSCLSCLGRNYPNPRNKALGLRPDYAGAEQPSILAHYYAQLPLELWPSCWTAQVFHLALSADLDQVVEIFTAVSPCPCDETQQVSKALELCHKCARLARCCVLKIYIKKSVRKYGIVYQTVLKRKMSCNQKLSKIKPAAVVDCSLQAIFLFGTSNLEGPLNKPVW